MTKKDFFELNENTEMATELHSQMLKSCKYHSDNLVNLEDVSRDFEKYYHYNIPSNTACLLISVSVIEAQLNWLIHKDNNAKRNLSISKKFNYLSEKGILPNTLKGIKEFQEFDLLISFRNEMVHYKAAFLKDGEFPNNKIKQLAKKAVIDVTEPWTTWDQKLLASSRLGPWIYKTVQNLYDCINSSLLNKN